MYAETQSRCAGVTLTLHRGRRGLPSQTRHASELEQRRVSELHETALFHRTSYAVLMVHMHSEHVSVYLESSEIASTEGEEEGEEGQGQGSCYHECAIRFCNTPSIF